LNEDVKFHKALGKEQENKIKALQDELVETSKVPNPKIIQDLLNAKDKESKQLKDKVTQKSKFGDPMKHNDFIQLIRARYVLDVDNYKMANELGQLKARLADIESQQGFITLIQALK
jgi:cell division FtsZ-interacting protein ZapD